MLPTYDARDERVLSLTSTKKDAELAQSILSRAGINCFNCDNWQQVCGMILAGAGVLLVVEEAISDDHDHCLAECLARQPAWSDFPVLVLAHQGADSATVAQAMNQLGNVTVIERPVRIASMVSAVRSALAARRRQYQARDHLAQIERRERDLSDFFDNASIGLHWVGPEGTILRVNQTELDMLGYRREEYVGHSIAEFHVDQSVIAEILVRLAEGETLRDYPARMRSKSGSIREVLINSNGLFENGEFIHSRCFTRDVTELNRAAGIRTRLAAIVEASDDAIVSKSLDGVIHTWNAGAEHLFGYTAEEAIGKSIELIIPPELLQEEQLILQRLRRGERIEHFDTVRVAKDGRRIDISLALSPIRDDAGNIIGASKVARDISDRKRIENEREQLLERERTARAQAEQAVRLKDEFLGTVSHELRTPLNGILGWAQLLKRARLDAKSVAEGIAAIERSARAQAQIIEDLLDMNRIMSGKLRLDVEPTDLVAVIEAALETIRPGAEAKGIRISTSFNTESGIVNGDATRLQQAVWNLLSNAVKFTPKGGNIDVRLERVDSCLEIVVTDTGLGIRPDFLPYVFERFRQADSSTTRQQGGLGLGLAIVKQIVELHGGSASVESKGEHQGSIFRIQLPAAITPSQGPEPQDPKLTPDNDVSFAGARFLVVDDDPFSCDVISRLFSHCGAKVEKVNSGQDALDRLSSGSYDILLCDIGMPEMDGYEVIGTLRSQGNSIPAIAITAYAWPEDRRRALEAGFSKFIPKPIDAKDLMDAVEELLRGARDEVNAA